GAPVRAVDGVSFDLEDGEILGVAGESGCGKSSLAMVLALVAQPPLEVVGGTASLAGRDLDVRQRGETRAVRGSVIALLPQGAMNSLNPTSRVRDFAFDVIRAHEGKVNRREAVHRAAERFEQLSLPPRVLDSYPHQLSGGMRQRVVAVISTLLNPSVLIADEPTSALDVSAQRQLCQLLRQLLERQFIRAVVFITHDLPLLGTVADRIAIMYAGKLAEAGPAREVLESPMHPYTQALVDTVLAPDLSLRTRRVEGIPGAPPDLRRPPSGCRFHPRCRYANDRCLEDPPQVGPPARFATCWRVYERQEEAVAEVGR
ncbi:MAG: ABC transporter ATP-binding protein, partial [Candidatus Dormibacteraeota bacterium]|nr:ABC transporter ATP-binding protein [Candidatus Dormibacteraeota bacterium]